MSFATSGVLLVLGMMFVVSYVMNQSDVSYSLSKSRHLLLEEQEPEDTFCRHGKMLPSLFIIGGMKCGTTAMIHDLEKFGTPSLDCGILNPKGRCSEKHFFAKSKEVVKGLQEYGKTFSECPSDMTSASQVVSMDKSISYILHPQVPRALVNLYSPSMIQASTFILILRDPVNRLVSEYGHHKLYGRMEKIKSFDAYALQMLTILRQKCPLYFSDRSAFDYEKCFNALYYEPPTVLDESKRVDVVVDMQGRPLYTDMAIGLLIGMFDLQLKHWIDTHNIPISSLLIVPFKRYTSSVESRLEVLQTIFQRAGLPGLASSLADNPEANQLPEQLNSKAQSKETMSTIDQLNHLYESHKRETEQFIISRKLIVLPSMTEEEIRNGEIW